MKKVSCGLIAMMMMLSMSGCSAKKNDALNTLNKTQVAAVQEEVEVFANGDISEITEMVFGVVPDEVSADEASDGIIANLFANAEVQITSSDNSTISYTIVSPDISDFFAVYAGQLDSITTSEELGQAILEYAKTAPTKEYTLPKTMLLTLPMRILISLML